MTDLIEEARQRCLTDLIDLKDQLQSITLPVEFKSLIITSNQICDEKFVKQFAKDLPVLGKHIYYFDVNETNSLTSSYEKQKQPDKFKYAKSNVVKNQDSKYVYVGSCGVVKLRDRFIQHCAWKDNSVYSLQLRSWVYNCDTVFTFNYIHMESSQAILQQIEDGLWSNLKPLFGKSGANNR